MSKFIPQGFGWVPDLPDPRDYTCRHDAVLPLLQNLRRITDEQQPSSIDLRRDCEGEYFTATEDQGLLNSSSAFAALSLVEYFERRIRGRAFEGSQLFLYQVTRNRLHKQMRPSGDTGADLRTTLKVLTSIGVPPNEQWPYETDRFDEEPSQFLYSMAEPLVGARYFRLDEPNLDGSRTWDAVTSMLAAGFPIAFGFAVPSSLNADANVLYRPVFDRIRGGQASVAVGYQNDHFGPGRHALLVRSSWGSSWGADGYGWLPSLFVRNQLARDFWTFIKEEWADSTELFCPHKLFESAT